MGENAFATRIGGPEPGDEPTGDPLSGLTAPRPAPKVDPLIGQVIQGRYRIISRIGDGGMGTVYLADQLSVGRKVALKVLHSEFTTDEEFVTRFRQEARLAASLSDRNVVTVYDFAQTDDGRLFIAMEYVNGRTLSDVIKQDGALSLARVVRLASRVASGLRAAHRAGVVHRDIKPQNILVVGAAGEEEVKLTDFGIARMRDIGSGTRLTRASVIMGTPEYMAPEQIQDAEVSEKTDIYAFGIVLYEMVSGDVPFSARTPAAVLTKHLQERPRPLGERRHGSPPELERLVMQTLEKNPADRPSDMSEVVKKLHAIRLTTGSPAVSNTAQITGWSGASRTGLRWRLGLAGGLVAVVALALAAVYWPRESDHVASTSPSASASATTPPEPIKPEPVVTPAPPAAAAPSPPVAPPVAMAPPAAAPLVVPPAVEPTVEPRPIRPAERAPEPPRLSVSPDPPAQMPDAGSPKRDAAAGRTAAVPPKPAPEAPRPRPSASPEAVRPPKAGPEKSAVYARDPAAVKRDVENALVFRGFGQVRVEIDDKGAVLLMGSVTGGEQAKQIAITTARQVPGVTSVKSSLFVWEEITGQAPLGRPERNR
ncbi:MAG TPA: protein kinase [Methylomirabilota bacterium]|jgi:serine/threonine-protein kinase